MNQIPVGWFPAITVVLLGSRTVDVVIFAYLDTLTLRIESIRRLTNALVTKLRDDEC